MNSQYALIILMLLTPVIGFSCADSLSSSIVCDGAAFVSSSLIGQGQTYAATLFASDLAVLVRNLNFDGDPETRTIINATGPLGVDEFTGQNTGAYPDESLCLFDTPENGSYQEAEIRTLGLLREGTYTSSRSLDGDIIALSQVNGSGIYLVRAGSADENQTVSMNADVMGEMNVSEAMYLGNSLGQ